MAAHIFETSGWDNIAFGSQGIVIGIIHIFSDFDLRMILCDLELFLRGGGWSSAGKPFSSELKILGEKVGYCQSLPSDVIYLGLPIVFIDIPPRYSRWRQNHLKSQMFHSNPPPLRLRLLQ